MSKKMTRDERRKGSPLMVRLDSNSKQAIDRAAKLRRISVSDYVRQITVAQARKEVAAARTRTISLTPEEQLAFWVALNSPTQPKLTRSQNLAGDERRSNEVLSVRPRLGIAIHPRRHSVREAGK